ncbi:right-handed parallel beta-helix repeat-containing protein [Pseudarthrobacter sulfonivorans]|uniref:right-handed parallel beta-helix repeat-containing protein n=1 Tax=Pseudarthrobacter sulfonivorans TaxID=121292 RepID=UPI00277E988B|nr:right-handed parallel beta-helix repeat-containing protein [Pseudarthrobacter sulfonivorans]MDP9998806.1 parallel beta-helix repeat protein [Pseudarthrobacter sulfonivorans]
MKTGRVIMVAALTATLATAGFIYAGSISNGDAVDAMGRNEIADNGNVQGMLYPGDPASEARLVEQEDERLVYVRTIASAARWRVEGLEGAYRIRTGSSYTLVLPARSAAYTVTDLLALAPNAFRLQQGGSYLLSESIAVLAGATLALASPDPARGLDLRLESGAEGFASVVALGGSLTLGGSEASKVSVSSWDSTKGGPDKTTKDGRAYIRVIGGHASFSHSNVSHLGFWSGNTGGLSLTGTDAVAVFTDEQPTSAEAREADGGARLLPEAELKDLTQESAQDYSVVTAGIENLRVDSNAFGLFVTNARDVAIKDTIISGSLVDGLVLHRFVTNATITGTSSSGNAVDGFSIGRSTEKISFENIQARDNGRNGLSMDGQPLADGPNAVGTAVNGYGGNQVSGGSFERNARYGIEVVGGSGLTLRNNRVALNEVGIVAADGATNVTIANNTLLDQIRQGVAIRDVGSAAVVTGNSITGGDTGIYVRDAGAVVKENTMNHISNHGITLLGAVNETSVEGNIVAGNGSTAIWAEASTGALVGDNDTLAWAPAFTAERVVKSVFQPLTFIWFLLGALLLVTAVARGKNAERVLRSPYADHVPLTSLSKGVVTYNDVRQLQ